MPPVAARSHQHTLPRPLTPFIGRAQELAQISRLLSEPDCRLLTLVGPGGIGKTRLALAAAAELSRDVVFLDLQALPAANHFPPLLADVLGISLTPQALVMAEVLRFLRSKSLLLLLDNCEGVPEVADYLVDLLTAVSGLTCLATSRAPFTLREEWLFPVHGMAYPEDDEAAGETRWDAVQFFVSCARRMRPNFSLPRERADVLRICRLTEGMPLALELAAAWTRALSCSEIAAEIQRSLSFLETEMRNVPQRHRSLQAIFDQSWQQLSPDAQQVFARLSTFRGGFSREAATAVAGASLSTLSTLVNCSLLRRSEDGRYHLHELLRQYGAERLAADPQAALAARRRHGDYFAHFLQTTGTGLLAGAQLDALAQIQPELGNIRAAWRQAVEEKNGAAVYKMAHVLSTYFQFRGRYMEPAQAMEEGIAALGQTAVSPQRDKTLGLMHLELTWLNVRFGRISKAKYHAAQAQALYEQHGILPPPGTATDPLLGFSLVASVRGDYAEAYRLGRQGYDNSVQQGHALNRQYACYGLAGAALGMGELETAARHAQEGLALCEANGDYWMRAYLLNLLGNVAMQQGDLQAAKGNHEASYQIRAGFQDPEGMATALNHLGEVHLQAQDAAAAVETFASSVDLYREINDRGGLATALAGLGQTAVLQRRFDTARRYFVEALEIAVEIEYLSLLQNLLERINGLLAQIDAAPLTPPGGVAAAQTVQTATAVLPQLRALALTDTPLPDDDERSRETAVDPVSPLIEPLTGRELEVLQYIARGMTNQQIADTLVLSLGTVKWYTGQIYGKLNVSNRTQAVARAQEMSIL